MKKLAVILALVSSLTLKADKPVDRGGWHRDVGLPEAEIADLYFSLIDLSLEDQRDQMWALSSNTKAGLWKLNILRYLRDHPELSAEAQQVLRDGIRLVSTPAWFDIVEGSFGHEPKALAREDFKSRVQSVLPRDAIHEVFIRLGPEPLIVSPGEPQHQNPRLGAPRSEWGYKCSCATNFDCGSSSSYDCFGAWCITTTHCGWFGDELCTGKCKSTEPTSP